MDIPRPVLTELGSEGLVYGAGYPEDLIDVENMRVRMLRGLGDAPALNGLPNVEIEALGNSLALTLGRAEYHEGRFARIIDYLEERRRLTRAEFQLDTLVKYALFEAAAALGGARLAVDELAFIACRRHGFQPKDWQPSVFLAVDKRAKLKETDYDVPEVDLLLSRLAWYDDLNFYRNALFHKGWGDPHKVYFPATYQAAGLADPRLDVFLIPDPTQPKHARPHEWTFTLGRRLPDLLRESMMGLRDVLDGICCGIWGATTPTPGSSRDLDESAILQPLPTPMAVVIPPTIPGQPHVVALPLFGSIERAQKFTLFPPEAKFNPARLPRVEPGRYYEQGAFLFLLNGLDEGLRKAGVTNYALKFPLDATSHTDMYQELLKASQVSPKHPWSVELPDARTREKLFCWRSAGGAR